MRSIFNFDACLAMLRSSLTFSCPDSAADKPIAIVIHGGAGNVPAERLTEERKARAIKKMNAALQYVGILSV